MRSNSGITMISVTIYVIVMAIIVAVVSVISTYFYRNVNVEEQNIDTSNQYIKFNSFFVSDINGQDSNISEVSDKGDYLIFENKTEYVFSEENSSIYRNGIRICENVDVCNFSMQIKNGKYVVEVIFKAVGQDQKTTSYVVKNKF